MSDVLGAIGLGKKQEHRPWLPEEYDYTERVTRYSTWWPFPDGATGAGAASARKKREENASQVAVDYYDLIMPSYEQGWGQSFHYCPMKPKMSIKENMEAYEIMIGELIGLKEGMKVLDVGCGLGGPARTMARKFGCKVVGLTNNTWQVERGTQLNQESGLGEMVEPVQGNFNVVRFFFAYTDIKRLLYSIS